ncbi:MAG: dephospho-CoA kinase [Solirubrobacteraceae bacterium]
MQEVERSVPLVGLTGGIGAGKSTALAALEGLGAVVLSTDTVVHELYTRDPRVREAVVERWGPEVAAAGVVDRAAIARRAFAGDQERSWLEGLLWPLVGERVGEWLTGARALSPPPPAAVVEVPLLFEAGMERLYDVTIAVVAPEALRRERAAGRGHELVQERAARQLSQEQKAARASFVVCNDGSETRLAEKLSEILAKLKG